MRDTNIHLENKTKSRQFFVFLFFMYALVYMTKYCFNIAMASIVSEGVYTKSQTGLITASFHIFYCPLQIVGGICADRYSPEKMIKTGLIGSAIVNTVIFIFCKQYYVVLTAWILNAVVQFAMWPSVFKIYTSQLVRSDRKSMAFIMSLSSSMGLLFGYLTAAFIPKWQYNFALSAVVLFILAISLHVICKNMNKYMVPDYDVDLNSGKTATHHESTFKLFLASGFFLMVVVTIIRTMIEQGTKTLAPTMLMESYANISPSIGNLLSVLIIFFGILGTVIIKTVLYPRFIKNEMSGHLAMMIITIPCIVSLRFVGNIPVPFAVASLCGIALFLTATHLLSSFYNMYFTKWGKNGTAAGVLNAAASLGIMIESYWFLKVAEKSSWQTVGNIWIVMIVIAVVLNIIAVPLANKFKKNI